MRELTIGSLFDGSGGFPLAAALEGIRPVWASEVEPYPIAVTRSRFPNMKHYGDVSKINGAEIEPVDIITFGSPCQDLSVAGKRAGLKHEAAGDEETTRSGLFLEAIRIIKEMREATHGVYPAYAIWENVTGAFSSSKGEDFRTVLNEFVQIVEPGAEVPPPPKGKWAYADILMGDGVSIAYRVFDAAKWGVPQRRRRIYLVADFRGQRAGKILFEREGLRGHPAPSREARERTAADTQNGIGATDTESVELYEPRSMKEENWTQQAVKGALRAEASKSAHVLIDSIGTADKSAAFKITNSATARTIGYEEEKSPTLSAENGGNAVPGVVVPLVMATQQANAEIAVDKSPTITAAAGMSGNNQPVLVLPTLVTTPLRPVGINGDVAGTLDASYYKGCGMRQGVEREVVATPPYTLKIRQGVERDSAGKKAGKGPLISENLSMTLGVSQDQYLFQPQLYENHSQDSRYTGPHEVAPTANAKYGTGGNNTPLVVLPIHDKATRHAGKRGEKHDGAGNGLGVGADGDPMYTLMGSDHHAVAYEVIPINTMVATRGGADDGRTTFGVGEPGEPQYTLQEAHSHAVAYGIDRAAFNQGENAQYKPKIEEEMSATIVARGPNAVALCTDIKFFKSYDNKGTSLLASQFKDPPLVCYWDGGQTAGTLTANNANGARRMPDKEHFNCVIEEDNVEQRYIVRRLTPLECCRLQGFPDGWGETDAKEDFADEEFAFWLDVRNTHGQINGKAIRHYTKAQMLTWYNKLHTDSAEYKMWGNGIALPCATYVMQGIVEAVKEDEENV